MKKYICILAGAALLAACEQKTETVVPETSPTASPEAATNAPEPASTTPPPAAESPATTPENTNFSGSWASPTPTP
ncbi:MAG TPA: hypothetical protein VMO75_01330 [Chthoniobacterales bacterium]|nr:hypothetical protein [Chthoniobacterales bacterium]